MSAVKTLLSAPSLADAPDADDQHPLQCSDEQPTMQELYVLNTRTYAMQRVAQSTDKPAAGSPSSGRKLFLVLWRPNTSPWQAIDARYEAYSYSGQHLSSFKDSEAASMTPVAHVLGGRAAVAHHSNFSLWNLDEGQLLGTAGPKHSYDAVPPRHALIAANMAGSKLIFCATQSSTLHIYDAVSLELLSTLLPGDGCSSDILALGTQDPTSGGIWGGYGLLLLHNVGSAYDESRPMELLQIHENSSKYSVISLGVTHNWVHERLAISSCSPCGTYLCRVIRHAPEIRVHDLRSGQIVCERTVGPLVEGEAQGICSDAAICWSRCGRHLMIVLCTRAIGSPQLVCEHLTILTLD